jgi:hypothetical protein
LHLLVKHLVNPNTQSVNWYPLNGSVEGLDVPKIRRDELEGVDDAGWYDRDV